MHLTNAQPNYSGQQPLDALSVGTVTSLPESGPVRLPAEIGPASTTTHTALSLALNSPTDSLQRNWFGWQYEWPAAYPSPLNDL